MEDDRVGIVLSGGGTHLFMHVGLLEALEDGGLLEDEQAQYIGGVYGNSAGSVIGSLFAQGYRPHAIWALTNWLIWNAQAPEDGMLWRYKQFQHPYDLSKYLTVDDERFRYAITHNLAALKGVLSGKKFLALLNEYVYGGTQYRAFEGNRTFMRPPHERFPFYTVMANLSTAQEVVARYREHVQVRQAVMLDAASAASPLLAVEGREAYYAFFDDLDLAEKPYAQRLSLAEAVYASAAQPVLFEPLYKPEGLWLWEKGEGKGERQLQRSWPYLVDGAVRDNYPLSIAAKVGGHTRIFGQMITEPGYPFRAIGQGTIVDMLTRTVYDLLLKTIYEADQDDAEIISRQVRSVLPYMLPRTKGLFDASIAGQSRDAGYLSGAYYLWHIARMHGTAGDNPQPFLQALITGQHKHFTWNQLFEPQIVRHSIGEWMHTGKGGPESGYRTITPQGDKTYIRLAQALLNTYASWRYPGENYGPVTPLETRDDDPTPIRQRELERRDIGPHEVDLFTANGALQISQRQIVRVIEQSLWVSAWGALILLYLAALVVIGLFVDTGWATRPVWLVLALAVAGVIARLIYRALIRQAWRAVGDFIRRKLTGT